MIVENPEKPNQIIDKICKVKVFNVESIKWKESINYQPEIK